MRDLLLVSWQLLSTELLTTVYDHKQSLMYLQKKPEA
jgi:hypothetical protein